GHAIDAVAQTTKQGYVFLFDRETGEPLFPIEEVSVPPSKIPGERAASTQPMPTMPKPFARQLLTEDMLTTRTPEMNAWAREQFSQFVSAGQFVPLRTDKATVIFPGFDGGAEWGGSAVDPQRSILYVNSNDLAWTGRLVASADDIGTEESLYRAQCAVCHGIDLEGAPPDFPALVGQAEIPSLDIIKDTIRNGKGRMPGFPALTAQEVDRLALFVMDPIVIEQDADAHEPVSKPSTEDQAIAYRFTGYDRFFDPDGYPAVEPPWGTLNAIDMNTGEYVWQIPLGEHPELVEQGLGNTGSENYGGPVVTATGLLFIGATLFDQKLRAFDATTGELLWEHEMPYSGMATPAIYMADGRQYIVIGTSNARNPKGQQGSAYIAFALPD
ncbi:MAG: c-type cytochrome, partial [Woeseiaceae bacterium]|nr:c-type cytochrome [Woeseiaceae bacterium]